MTADPPATRRTQDERRAETTAKILAASIESFWANGWSSVSTVDIAERAGVSRGAVRHYFPSNEALFAVALETEVNRAMSEMAVRWAQVPGLTSTDRFNQQLELFWELICGPTLTLVRELLVASRTDEGLARTVGAVIRKVYDRWTEEFADHYFGKPGVPDIVRHLGARGLFAILNGMALEAQGMAGAGDDWAEPLLESIRGLWAMLVSSMPDVFVPGSPAAGGGAPTEGSAGG